MLITSQACGLKVQSTETTDKIDVDSAWNPSRSHDYKSQKPEYLM